MPVLLHVGVLYSKPLAASTHASAHSERRAAAPSAPLLTPRASPAWPLLVRAVFQLAPLCKRDWYTVAAFALPLVLLEELLKLGARLMSTE